MLTVKSPEEALSTIEQEFSLCIGEEWVPLHLARGRVLARTVTAEEYVPGFDRSTVDGYAVSAKETFGCSEAIPAMLELGREIGMGEEAGEPLQKGQARYVPTGGAVPTGADAVVMIEYIENYGDGTVGVLRPAAPGENLIYRGDDVFPGKEVLPAGHVLGAHDIGALAALGKTEVCVRKRPKVGILSTGDELVGVDEIPAPGQVRDVNSAMLAALMEEFGAESLCYGVIEDEKDALYKVLKCVLSECDMVLISGGSSVGAKDATAAVMESLSDVLFHGIAIKPGKPTILGKAGEKPVFGLPGHPVAAYFVGRIFVRAALVAIMGTKLQSDTVPAVLSEPVSANHGRAQYVGVRLKRVNGVLYACPIRGKSGLITALAASDGFFCIPRDCEGVARGERVDVVRYHMD